MTPNPWDIEYKNARPNPVYTPLWEMLDQFLQTLPGKSLLDFGCGDGNYSCLMMEKGFEVTGIDVSEKAIQKAIACNGEDINFIRSGAIPDDIPTDAFDVVVMLNSLHCLRFEERERLLSQVKRVLKRDGRLFASVLSLEDESYPRQNWEEIEPGTFDDGIGRLFHFFTMEQLTAELKGFRIVETKTLQNVHPDVGRKSALFVITAQKMV